MEEGGSKEAVSTAHGTQTELKPSIQPIYHLEILYMMNHLAALYPAAPVPQKCTLTGSTHCGLISNPEALGSQGILPTLSSPPFTNRFA